MFTFILLMLFYFFCFFNTACTTSLYLTCKNQNSSGESSGLSNQPWCSSDLIKVDHNQLNIVLLYLFAVVSQAPYPNTSGKKRSVAGDGDSKKKEMFTNSSILS